ncbi:hypothetical protein [Nonomuraea antimicrobica]|uniref:hypothetical protein n=1 Tax=Nonomuraea antimicrobica TaxID=561173 RepID=UPI0031EAD1B4
MKTEIREDLVGYVLNMIPDTNIGGGGFGRIGNLIIASDYGRAQGRGVGYLHDVRGAADSWVEGLTNCERNWVTAENLSMVRYRG